MIVLGAETALGRECAEALAAAGATLALGGLDAVVDATGVSETPGIAESIVRREMDRTGGGVYVVAADAGAAVHSVAADNA